MSFFPTSLDFSVYTKYYTLSEKIDFNELPPLNLLDIGCILKKVRDRDLPYLELLCNSLF